MFQTDFLYINIINQDLGNAFSILFLDKFYSNLLTTDSEVPHVIQSVQTYS